MAYVNDMTVKSSMRSAPTRNMEVWSAERPVMTSDNSMWHNLSSRNSRKRYKEPWIHSVDSSSVFGSPRNLFRRHHHQKATSSYIHFQYDYAYDRKHRHTIFGGYLVILLPTRPYFKLHQYSKVSYRLASSWILLRHVGIPFHPDLRMVLLNDAGEGS